MKGVDGIVCRICQLLFGNSKVGSAVEMVDQAESE